MSYYNSISNHFRRGWENSFATPLFKNTKSKYMGTALAVATIASAFFTCSLMKGSAASLPLICSVTLGAVLGAFAITCLAIVIIAGFKTSKNNHSHIDASSLFSKENPRSGNHGKDAAKLSRAPDIDRRSPAQPQDKGPKTNVKKEAPSEPTTDSKMSKNDYFQIGASNLPPEIEPETNEYDIDDSNLSRAIEADIARRYHIRFLDKGQEISFKTEDSVTAKEATNNLFKHVLDLPLPRHEKKSILNCSMQIFFIEAEHKIREIYARVIEVAFFVEPDTWYLNNIKDSKRSPQKIVHDLVNKTTSGKAAFLGWTLNNKTGDQERLFEIDVTATFNWNTKKTTLEANFS